MHLIYYFKSNKVKYFPFYFILLYCFYGCDQVRKGKPGYITIEGHIENPSFNKMYFNSFPDSGSIYIGIKSRMDSTIISNSGDYSLSVPADKGYTFDLQCGDSDLVNNLNLVPGDKLTINFIGKRNKPEIFPGDQDAKFNTFLLMFVDSFYRYPDTKQEYYIATNYMDIESFAKYNDRRKQKQIDFFKNYFGDYKLKKEYADYAMNTINYGIANDRFMYLWKKRMKGEHIVADASYFSFLTPAFIENPDAFNCPAYIRFLNLYIKDTYERMVERGELPVKKGDGLIPQVEKYKLAVKLLNKPYRDAVIYSIIDSDTKDISYGGIQPVMAGKSLNEMIEWFEKKYSLK